MGRDARQTQMGRKATEAIPKKGIVKVVADEDVSDIVFGLEGSLNPQRLLVVCSLGVVFL